MQESDDILEKNFQRETEGLLDIKTFVSKRGELLKKQNVLGDVERAPPGSGGSALRCFSAPSLRAPSIRRRWASSVPRGAPAVQHTRVVGIQCEEEQEKKRREEKRLRDEDKERLPPHRAAANLLHVSIASRLCSRMQPTTHARAFTLARTRAGLADVVNGSSVPTIDGRPHSTAPVRWEEGAAFVRR